MNPRSYFLYSVKDFSLTRMPKTSSFFKNILLYSSLIVKSFHLKIKIPVHHLSGRLAFESRDAMGNPRNLFPEVPGHFSLPRSPVIRI